LYAGYISSDLLYRRSQLRITAPRYEDVRAFVHELLRRRKADAAIATRNEWTGARGRSDGRQSNHSETAMSKTTPEQNKALVLKAFDTLFNKRDYEAAARF
jgi:hypothetical protein